MRNIWIGSLLCLMAIGGLSCQKMLNVDSTRAVTEENMWKSKNDAWAGSFACYALLRAALANENAYWAYGEMRAGDFTVTKRGDLEALRRSELTANYTTMDSWRDWRRFYAAIAQCNLAIAKLPGIPALDNRYSVTEMQLDLAQVRYVRAFIYFYIVRIWGDVPLIRDPSDGTFTPVAREGWQKVLDFAAAEAQMAFDKLPWQYDGKSPESPGNYRGQGISHWRSILATKGAALTLLAHIAAWKKDYQTALNYINRITDNQTLNNYNFVTTANLVKSEGSPSTFRGRTDENIFQVDLNLDHAEISTTGQLEDWTLRAPDVPKKEAEIYVSKDSILNIYNEITDERGALFFADLGSINPMFYKVKQLSAALKNPTLRFFNSAIVIFRYEELILLRAECKARLGIASAVDDVNAVRSRRVLPNLANTITGPALLDWILQERRRELIGEGWHWFDLISFNKIPAYTKLSAEDVRNGAAYWPLSKSALSLNPALTQNNFWK